MKKLIAATAVVFVLAGCQFAAEAVGSLITVSLVDKKEDIIKYGEKARKEFCALSEANRDAIRKDIGNELRAVGVNIKFSCATIPDVVE